MFEIGGLKVIRVTRSNPFWDLEIIGGMAMRFLSER